MAITFVAAAGHSTNLETISPHDIVISKPSGVAQNDIMLAFIQVQGNIGSFDSVPAGWTALSATGYRTPTTSNAGLFGGAWWKRAGGAESTSYTFSLSGSSIFGAAIVAYAGCSTGAGVIIASGSAEDDTTTDTTVTAPSVSNATTSTSVALVTAHLGNPSCTACTVTWTPPAGMVERYDSAQSDDGTTLRTALEVNDLIANMTTGAASGTKDATISNDGRNIGISVLLLAKATTTPPPSTGSTTMISVRRFPRQAAQPQATIRGSFH